MEPNHIGAGKFKTKKIIDNEFVEGLQKKRSAPQRCTVKLFPLLVAQCFFYDLNAKFRAFAVYVIIGIF